MGASLGAAEAGASVVLAERYGFLGGNATAALVMPFVSFHTQSGAPEAVSSRRVFPRDHGPGVPVVAGVLKKLVARLSLTGDALEPSPETGYTVPFDPEAMKSAALSLLEEAGVELLLHSMASDVVTERPRPACERKRIGGVVFETKQGPVVVRANTVIDCTGDGDIAAFSGTPFEMGRDEDGLVQPMTLMFRMTGFDERAFSAFARSNERQWKGVHGLWDLVYEAAAAGELHLPREDILFFGGIRSGEVFVNSTRVAGVSGTNVVDLTRAELVARRQMSEIVRFLRRRVPGFERGYLVQSGGIGVRETRRVVGEYRLCMDDVMSGRKFSDVIARCPYPVDIHDPAGVGTRLERLPDGECYDIPLRCLIPRRVDCLLVAGRCISGSHEAHSSYRVMPTSVATGQAAGVCAALAAEYGHAPRAVPSSAVQRELLRQGASLGEDVSSRLSGSEVA